MRLLICTGTFPPDTSGPATYVNELVPALQKLGWQIKILTYGDGPVNYSYSVTRISRDASLFVRYWRYYQAAKKLAKDCDLVYLQGPVSEGLPGAWAARQAKKPYVLKVVGDYAWEQAKVQYADKRDINQFQKSTSQDNLKIKIWRVIERRVARQARLVITPSKYLAGVVLGWGVKPEKIKVIYNAFKPGWEINSSKEQLRQELVINQPTILSVGRLVPWKGFAGLIGAMAKIKNFISDAQLIIIGDGPDHQALENLVNQLNLSSVVKLMGQVPFIKTQQYMIASDCLVLNSSYEGLSHVLLEAMDAGTGIIATDVCGNGEVIEHDVNGILVPYGDQQALVSAVIKMLTNQALREKYVQAYPVVLEKFRHERLVNETVIVLESSIA